MLRVRVCSQLEWERHASLGVSCMISSQTATHPLLGKCTRGPTAAVACNVQCRHCARRVHFTAYNFSCPGVCKQCTCVWRGISCTGPICIQKELLLAEPNIASTSGIQLDRKRCRLLEALLHTLNYTPPTCTADLWVTFLLPHLISVPQPHSDILQRGSSCHCCVRHHR